MCYYNYIYTSFARNKAHFLLKKYDCCKEQIYQKIMMFVRKYKNNMEKWKKKKRYSKISLWKLIKNRYHHVNAIIIKINLIYLVEFAKVY